MIGDESAKIGAATQSPYTRIALPFGAIRISRAATPRIFLRAAFRRGVLVAVSRPSRKRVISQTTDIFVAR